MTIETTTCLKCGKAWNGTKEENQKGFDAHAHDCNVRYEKEHQYAGLTPGQVELRKLLALESIADSLWVISKGLPKVVGAIEDLRLEVKVK